MGLVVRLAVRLVVDQEALDAFRLLLFGFHRLDREALVVFEGELNFYIVTYIQ